MYKTDYAEKIENGASLLQFISERDEAIESIKRRNKLMRIAYIGVFSVFVVAGLGISMFFI